MKKLLTLALALVALAVFTGVAVAQQKGEEKKPTTAPVMEQRQTPKRDFGDRTGPIRLDPTPAVVQQKDTQKRPAGAIVSAAVSSSLAQACKDKKPGTGVTVDDKKLKCPASGSPAPIAVSNPGRISTNLTIEKFPAPSGSAFPTPPAVEKTKHDTVKNTINNVR
jgi:hypothetical protein